MNPHRAALAREKLKESELEAFLVSGRDNIRWLTGFSGSSGIALVTAQDVHIFTDSRYTIQAGEEAPGARIHISNDPPVKQASAVLRELRVAAAGFESDSLTYENYSLLRVGMRTGKLVGLKGLISALRYVKDANELGLLQEAAAVTDAAFEEILPYLTPGVTEKHVLRELVYVLSKCGADQEAFPSIVASGPRSALPHAQPTDRVLRVGEPVLLDFGASCAGYAGDITRTVFLGEADDKFRKVYDTVLKAQRESIAAIRPGKTGKEVDAVARTIISDAGYGEAFGHGLGHSLGLNVHDGPALSPRSTLTLSEGMVVTVEPGIYIEGWGGVRIEDDVVVCSDGAEVLTDSPKELMELRG